MSDKKQADIIDLETFKQTGLKTQRVIRMNMDYLNRRVVRYCHIDKKETLHDPMNGNWKCCTCDMVCKDTDLGVLYFTDHWQKL